MGLLENLGRIFKKTGTSENVVLKKSSVKISDKPKTSGQDAAASRIFPREPQGTNPEGLHNCKDVTVDIEGFGNIFDFFSGSPPKSGPRPGPDLLFTLEITPKTAGSGRDYDLEVIHTEPCISCDGSGSETRRTITCSVCGGGRVERKDFESPHGKYAHVTTCSACGGKGEVPEQACKECHGTGHVFVERDVTVYIPAVTNNYSRFYFEGLGNAGDYHGKNGDLVIRINFC
jgi:molecular chaperone DnaJ